MVIDRTSSSQTRPDRLGYHRGSTMDELVATFIEACPLQGQPPPALATLLAELAASGRGAWPKLSLAPAVFVRHLAVRVAVSDPVEACARLEALRPRAAELFLSTACAEGLPPALAEFDARYLSAVPHYLARMKADSSFVEEVRQRLRVNLLMTLDGKPPRIAQYGGRGPLTSWVRVAALHLAISLRRGERGDVVDDDGDIERHGSLTPDPEIELLARRYRPVFEAALRDALAHLDAPAREILRLYYFEGLTVDALGERLGVGRSTAARRVASARMSVFAHTRRLLHERLEMGASAFESLARHLKSQLAISLTNLLVDKS
jgi:RNA polymerase sigma-70 factor (ECF subfamily)